MPRPSGKSPEQELQVVLSALRREQSAAEAGVRHPVHRIGTTVPR